MRLTRVPLERAPWSELDAYADRTVFQTRAWLAFLEESQAAEPVLLQLRRGSETVGWFTGAVVRRFGFRFLGSPLRGWTTSYMGFNLRDDADVASATNAVRGYAFSELGCLHCELMDRRFEPYVGVRNGFRSSTLPSYEVDLTRPADRILAAMNQARRHAIRRAPRNGVVVEQAHGVPFADEHYEQLRDVFAKRSLPPPYPVERIRQLIRHLEPTGTLLLVRARAPDGRSIATGIFPAFGRRSHFWMGASWRSHQKLLPNEAIQWFAMNYWKERGVVAYDMGGGGEYKSKYGGSAIEVAWLRASRFDALERVRAQALDVRKRVRKWMGRRAGLK